MRGCGNAHPPADGTRNREIIDRFSDFLREAGPPAVPDHKGGWTFIPSMSAAKMYRRRFLAWRVSQVPADA